MVRRDCKRTGEGRNPEVRVPVVELVRESRRKFHVVEDGGACAWEML
jgi:hypothetical protein